MTIDDNVRLRQNGVANGKERRNVILCGFMATGKSSVAKLLAAKLGYEFIDMDALIEEEAGMPVARIFATRGEPAFRAMEADMVDRISRRSGCVVATGGGVIVNPVNLEKLKGCGVVVTLTADVETILLRAGSDETRPLLHGDDKRERIRTLLKQREPFYSRADIVVDTSPLTIEEVAESLAGRLRESGFVL